MIFVPQLVTSAQPRRGAILLVVMAMLALFAAVGLSFVYYADSESTASKHFRQSVNLSRPEVEPELLLGYFLNQFLFDTPDVYSAMRGHSLGRTMYGYKSGGPNNVPFNGAGRLSFPVATFGNQDSLYLFNYTQYETTRSRDPEIYNGQYIGCNASWTYPDLHNLCLAAVNADGEVLIQSFHRPWAMSQITDATCQKYATLRPHKSYHPSFLSLGDPNYPGDPGGDVKNLDFAKGVKYPGGYYYNDSFWMDLGFGVLTDATTGKKYKPLFAPLIIDLDGKVNITAAGSFDSISGLFKGSNHGLGPWEINLSQVVKGGDWQNIFIGYPGKGIPGRYGYIPPPNPPYPKPAAGGLFTAVSTGAGPTYASTDMDGTGGNRYLLPGEGANSPFTPFPQFNPATYGNGNAAEQTDHPGLFNPLVKAADDRLFAAAHLELLLRHGGTGAHALTSDLCRLCPISFLTDANAARWRRLVTTHSCDLGRPGITPWLYPNNPAPYTLAGPYPSGGALPLPPPANWSTYEGTGEFDKAGSPTNSPGRGFAQLPAPGRLNINRPLTDYPAPAGNNVITDMVTFNKAQTERQTLARDIFDCLRLVCTGARPSNALPATGSPEYQAQRWLAQLAVNIVDYRDQDEYSTPFNWDTSNPGDPNNWVFGVEMPRVVINEVYAEVTNDPADPKPMMKASKDFKCNFWVELLNPTPDIQRLHNPRLDDPPAFFPVYKVQIAVPGAGLFSESNLGTPDAANTKLEVADYVQEDPPTPQPLGGMDVNVIRPDANGDFQGTPGDNELFYVLGPKYDFPGAKQATLRVKEKNIAGVQSAMSYNMDYKNTDLTKLPQHKVFLRRLACPHLPPQLAPGPDYNPYLTVDYVTDIETYDGVEYDKDGMNGDKVAVGNRKAKGRKQPYSAVPVENQNAVAGEPAHTFFLQNSNIKTPFDWLTHLDRSVMSPIELLQVSALKPFELTQQFVVGGIAHSHRAPWSDGNARIYRLLEFLDAGWRANGVSQNGRIPGKININTIWDVETFRALCDKNGVSSYTDSPDTVFNKMLASRTPAGVPSASDRPFRGLSTGDTANPVSGLGLGDTVLRPGVFDVSPTNVAANHPYQQKELLSKIFNNVTTRSNVFAVWVTVGFFEVTDDTVRPARLGAEIGRAEGRHVRHRMFAIVDRSVLTSNPGPLTRFNPRENTYPGLVPYFSIIE